MTQSIAEVLQKTDLFQDVNFEDLKALAEVLDTQEYEPNEVLFNLGDIGDAMYIIQSGQVRIYTIDEEGHDLTLMHYGANQLFGEFSLLDSKPRSASASAATDEPLKVLVLNRQTFMRFLNARPQVSLAMMRSLAQRARYTTTYVEEVVHWAKRLANGEYKQAIQEISDTQQDDANQIQGLIGAFLQMAKSVQEREEELKRQVVELQVQIDEEQRVTQVRSITRSDFFANLKQQAKKMRAETGQISASDVDENAEQ